MLYGPLITADIYSGNCFKDNEKKSFKMETLEPWLAFTVKIPLVGQDGNLEALGTSNDLLYDEFLLHVFIELSGFSPMSC